MKIIQKKYKDQICEIQVDIEYRKICYRGDGSDLVKVEKKND